MTFFVGISMSKGAVSVATRALSALVLLGGLAGTPGPAAAQLLTEVDQAELDNWRIASGNEIRFCQFDSNLTNDFDRAIGEEIAARLLLESKFVMLGSNYGMDGEGIEVDLFRSLWNQCDVALGFEVGDVLYAPEFTVTRPYVNYDYLILATDDSYRSVDDMPAATVIGTPIASPGDLALARWIATERSDRTWRRLPFGRAEDQMDAVLNETVDGMLLFAPVYSWLAKLRPQDAPKFHLVKTNPAIASATSIGGMMLAGSSFLRIEIDRTIDGMVEDGTIMRILAEHGMDSIPARPGGA